MTYELAKALKDAGFPQHHWHPGLSSTLAEYDAVRGKETYSPTLSELIEACGDGFYGIHRMVNGEWLAFMYDIEDSTRQLETKGATAEEAVAFLWLALHNSKPYNEKSEM